MIITLPIIFGSVIVSPKKTIAQISINIYEIPLRRYAKERGTYSNNNCHENAYATIIAIATKKNKINRGERIASWPANLIQTDAKLWKNSVIAKRISICAFLFLFVDSIFHHH